MSVRQFKESLHNRMMKNIGLMNPGDLKPYIAKGGKLSDGSEWSVFTNFVIRGLRLRDESFIRAAFSFNPSVELVRETLLAAYLCEYAFTFDLFLSRLLKFMFSADCPLFSPRYLSIFQAEGELVPHDDRSWIMTPMETALYIERVANNKYGSDFTAEESQRPYGEIVKHYINSGADPNGFFVVPLIEMLDVDSMLAFIERGADPEAGGFFVKHNLEYHLPIDRVLKHSDLGQYKRLILARKLGLGSSRDLKRYILQGYPDELAVDYGLELDPRDFYDIIMSRKFNFRDAYYGLYSPVLKICYPRSLRLFTLPMLQDVEIYIPERLSDIFKEVMAEKS